MKSLAPWSLRVLAPQSRVNILAAWQSNVTACDNARFTREGNNAGDDEASGNHVTVEALSNAPLSVSVPRRCQSVTINALHVSVTAQDKLEAVEFTCEAASVDLRASVRADRVSIRSTHGSIASHGGLEATVLALDAAAGLSAKRLSAHTVSVRAGDDVVVQALYATLDAHVESTVQSVALYSLHCARASVSAKQAVTLDSLSAEAAVLIVAGSRAIVHVDKLATAAASVAVTAGAEAHASLSPEALPCRVHAPASCVVSMPDDQSARFVAAAAADAEDDKTRDVRGVVRSADIASAANSDAAAGGLLTLVAPASRIAVQSWVEGFVFPSRLRCGIG